MTGTQPDVDEAVERAMVACRDSLAALEQRYEEVDDADGDPAELARIQGRVVAYSHFVAALREHVEQARRGKALSRRLAERVDGFVAELDRHGEDPLLHPSVEEARALAASARAQQ